MRVCMHSCVGYVCGNMHKCYSLHAEVRRQPQTLGLTFHLETRLPASFWEFYLSFPSHSRSIGTTDPWSTVSIFT